MKINADVDLQLRMTVLEQDFVHGTVSAPEDIKICVMAQLFRTNHQQFPLPADKVSLTSLRSALVETNGGKYTWSLSACVSEKIRVPAGVYILVPSTFDPASCAKFQMNLYCTGNMLVTAPYQHSC